MSARRPPYGEWVQASEWKRYVNTEDRLCFRTITDDLARYDIHPPFYFWLLHIWCLLVGVHLWTGPMLNSLLAAATAVSLFLLIRDVWGDNARACAVAAIWTLSPTVMATSSQARQYDLLALCTVVFTWTVFRCAARDRVVTWREAGYLGLATAAGLLVHYHFPLVLLGGVAVLCFLLRRQTRRLLRCGAGVTGGVLLFILLNPHFLQAVSRARHQLQEFSGLELRNRLRTVAARYASMFVDTSVFAPSARTLLSCVVLGGFLLLFASALWIRIGRRDDRGPMRALDLTALAFFAWMAVTNIALYLACLSPRHAMEPKHVSAVYPFYALAIGTLVFSFRRVRLPLAAALVLLVAGFGQYSATHYVRLQHDRPQPLARASAGDSVLVDTTNRLVLPCAALRAPKHVQMFVADRKDLLASNEWQDHLPKRTLWVAYGRKPGEQRLLQALVSRLSTQYRIRRLPGSVALRAMVVELARRSTE